MLPPSSPRPWNGSLPTAIVMTASEMPGRISNFPSETGNLKQKLLWWDKPPLTGFGLTLVGRGHAQLRLVHFSSDSTCWNKLEEGSWSKPERDHQPLTAWAGLVDGTTPTLCFTWWAPRSSVFCTFISYNTAFCSRLIFLLSLLVPFVAAQRREDIFTTLNTSTIVGFLDMFPFFKKNG